jgi:hypothetical protein
MGWQLETATEEDESLFSRVRKKCSTSIVVSGRVNPQQMVSKFQDGPLFSTLACSKHHGSAQACRRANPLRYGGSKFQAKGEGF